MSFEIIVTPPFEKELKQLSKKYPSIKKDIAALGVELMDNPKMGVPLGNDCFKIRMSITSKSRGKSGGARVITHVKVTSTAIFLLSIYDKAETSTITDEELISRLKKLVKK
jgi:mRNA-degrading endonuclease RelE of RelBE toxin-antitoxin system